MVRFRLSTPTSPHLTRPTHTSSVGGGTLLSCNTRRRGTGSGADTLCLNHAGGVLVGAAESAPLEDGGYAHTGMLEAARWFMKHESKHLTELMQRHPTYQLKVLGHSLGAGTAALLTMLVRAGSSAEEQGAVMDAAMRARVSCTAVATPPCLSYDLAVATAPYVTSVVLDDDVIPRTSLVSLYNMQVETLETDWCVVDGLCVRGGAMWVSLLCLASQWVEYSICTAYVASESVN